MSEFFSMGGYAAYVWPCYLLVLLIMGGLTISSLRGYQQARDKVRQLEKLLGRDEVSS